MAKQENDPTGQFLISVITLISCSSLCAYPSLVADSLLQSRGTNVLAKDHILGGYPDEESKEILMKLFYSKW